MPNDDDNNGDNDDATSSASSSSNKYDTKKDAEDNSKEGAKDDGKDAAEDDGEVDAEYDVEDDVEGDACAVYCMSKAALDILTWRASVELARQGVHVSPVNPGIAPSWLHEVRRLATCDVLTIFLPAVSLSYRGGLESYRYDDRPVCASSSSDSKDAGLGESHDCVVPFNRSDGRETDALSLCLEASQAAQRIIQHPDRVCGGFRCDGPDRGQ